MLQSKLSSNNRLSDCNPLPGLAAGRAVATTKPPKRKRKHETPTPELAGLPERLKTALTDSGLDDKVVAEKSGVDAGQISRLKNGKQLLGVAADKLVRLAKATGVPPAKLITGATWEAFTISLDGLRGEEWTHLEIRPQDGGAALVVVPVTLPGNRPSTEVPPTTLTATAQKTRVKKPQSRQ